MVKEAKRVNVRMSPKEIQMVDSLGDYLKEEGKLRESNRSNVVRYSVRFLANAIMSQIEKRRYGGEP